MLCPLGTRDGTGFSPSLPLAQPRSSPRPRGHRQSSCCHTSLAFVTHSLCFSGTCPFHTHVYVMMLRFCVQVAFVLLGGGHCCCRLLHWAFIQSTFSTFVSFVLRPCLHLHSTSPSLLISLLISCCCILQAGDVGSHNNNDEDSPPRTSSHGANGLFRGCTTKTSAPRRVQLL